MMFRCSTGSSTFACPTDAHTKVAYFFHGRNLAILGHALTKEEEVPKADIERAIRRKKAFEANPSAHSYAEEEKK
jgi:hypothetical protein